MIVFAMGHFWDIFQEFLWKTAWSNVSSATITPLKFLVFKNFVKFSGFLDIVAQIKVLGLPQIDFLGNFTSKKSLRAIVALYLLSTTYLYAPEAIS